MGSIYRSNPDSRRTQIDLPDHWLLVERLFVFWLALVIWKREEACERASREAESRKRTHGDDAVRPFFRHCEMTS